MSASNTLTTKLSKISENFTINIYENGYMVEVNGVDRSGDWKSVKLIVNNREELVELVKQIVELERTE